ncbi:hypothetical protein [Streptacidiphilus fuscans]|uniref:Mce-associated membrane protein n=1 Tax=Streptacidiphilus fuscans TaxID=2789292 RepID=A0A931B2V1_9ACTN|nr:hypothetical protein [Streptacidiphilus fuscans]MBF9069268.1 hypothetical protein [Streptacidiphilus fuscans]
MQVDEASIVLPDASVDEEATPARRWAGWSRARGVLALAVAVPLVAAALLGWRATHLPGSASLANRALTDTAATAQVESQVGSALDQILSYTPDGTGATAQAASQLLTGQASSQYRTLFGQVAPRAQEQRLTLTTTVARIGVESLTAGQARLLVFLDQTAQRQGAAPSTVPAQLAVTAVLRGGRWLISSLDVR